MIVSLIVATDERGSIGKDGTMPWYLPADLSHFKKTTMGKPIIMGRVTYESIGRPLPGRRNIVITRNRHYRPSGVDIAHSLEEALDLASRSREVFIIGGQQIYEQALPFAQRIYMTLVHTKQSANKFFSYESAEWKEKSRQSHSADDKNKYDYDFIVLEPK